MRAEEVRERCGNVIGCAVICDEKVIAAFFRCVKIVYNLPLLFLVHLRNYGNLLVRS